MFKLSDKNRARAQPAMLVIMLLATIISAGFTGPAEARCREAMLERYLKHRAFSLPAGEKIALYDRRLARYYDNDDISRRAVRRSMENWERRWPDRLYEFLRITDFTLTDRGDACRVIFDYRFLAHNDARGKTSAGIGQTTLVLANSGGSLDMKIVAEWGDVRCRGMSAFIRKRC